MDYETHFRKKDIPTAEKEVNCVLDLLHLIKKHMELGEIEQAKTYDEDAKKSLENLVTLNQLKVSQDKHEALTR